MTTIADVLRNPAGTGIDKNGLPNNPVATAQDRVGDEENAAAPGNSDGRYEVGLVYLLPAVPFAFGAIEIADGIRSRIGQTEVIIFVEGQGKGFDERLVATVGAGDPIGKTGHGGPFCIEVRRAGDGSNESKTRRDGRRRPDKGIGRWV